MTTTLDRIERQVFLKAPRSRVWRALTDAKQFGSWFGVEAEGAFATGARVRLVVTHPEHKGLSFDMVIEEMVPEQTFAWRWYPNAIEPNRDYSSEPPTLVVFRLEEAPGGTLLKVVESGFEALPAGRRLEAYRGNEKGWDEQMKNIERYVTEG
jgi:uncharacterized protein YndB with AHSA1/START domain